VTSAGSDPTLIEISDSHIVAISVEHVRVIAQWYGPRRAEMTPEAARTLGYVLRSYARIADAGTEP
jgi:hypothetical protein